jgi:hypothetical protein
MIKTQTLNYIVYCKNNLSEILEEVGLFQPLLLHFIEDIEYIYEIFVKKYNFYYDYIK